MGILPFPSMWVGEDGCRAETRGFDCGDGDVDILYHCYIRVCVFLHNFSSVGIVLSVKRHRQHDARQNAT
jgi:hypothetical protein